MKPVFFIALVLAICCAFVIQANEVSSSILVSGTSSWDKSHFQYPEGKSEISVQKIKVTVSKEKLSLALHCHTMPLAAYVLKGNLEVVKLTGEREAFTQGDAFIEVMNQWHKGVFTEDTELIVFYAGAKGNALSFSKDSSDVNAHECH